VLQLLDIYVDLGEYSAISSSSSDMRVAVYMRPSAKSKRFRAKILDLQTAERLASNVRQDCGRTFATKSVWVNMQATASITANRAFVTCQPYWQAEAAFSIMQLFQY